MKRKNSIRSKRISSREQSLSSNKDDDDEETVHTCIILSYNNL